MGEIVGLDAISSDAHTCDAIALEDTEICEIPFARLEELSRHMIIRVNIRKKDRYAPVSGCFSTRSCM